MLKAISDLTLPQEQCLEPSVNITSVLGRLRRVAPSGSMIIILSDFEQADSATKRHLSQLAQHHQLICGLIYDPFEQYMPDVGYAALTDGQERLLLNTRSDRVRAQYAEQFALKLKDIEQFMTRHGQSFFSLATNQELLPLLHEVLQQFGAVRHR